MENIRHLLLKGTLWTSGSRVAINILALLGTMVIARLLVPADFGIVAIGTTMLAIFSSLTEIPLAESLINQKVVTTGHLNTVWTLSIMRAIGAATCFSLLSWPIFHFYRDERIVIVILLLSLSIIVTGFINPMAIMATKGLVFWQQATLQMCQKVVGLLVSLLLAFSFKAYWAIPVGAVAGQLASTFISYFIMPFRPKLSLAYRSSVLSFSGWLMLSQIINSINWNFDQLAVGLFLGSHSLGLYNVGSNLAAVPTRETTAPITWTLFPAFSAIRNEQSRLRLSYQSAQSLVMAIALPAGVGTALLADRIVNLVMGKKWDEAIAVIQILSSVFAIQTLGSLAQPLAMSVGLTRLLFRRDVQSLVLRLPLIALGMYSYGLSGILAARCVAGVLSIIFNLHIVKHITKLGLLEQIKPNFRCIGSVVIMAVSMRFCNSFLFQLDNMLPHFAQIVILMLFGVLIYSSSMIAFWVGMGRPRGPETELVNLAQRMRNNGNRNKS